MAAPLPLPALFATHAGIWLSGSDGEGREASRGEAIARAAGVKAIMDDDALYGDSLGVPNSDGATYIGSIIHNVTTLVEAWDGEAADLPESLDNAR